MPTDNIKNITGKINNMKLFSASVIQGYMETNNKKENQMKKKPENWEVVEVSDNLLDNFSSFISYEVRSNRGHTVAKSLTQNDASLVASAPEMLDALNNILCYFSEYEDDYNEKLECFENARKVIDRAEEK